MRPLDRLRSLGSTQHGVVSRRQAAALGVDRAKLRPLVGNGEIRIVTDRVFAFTAAPSTDDQKMALASLHFAPAFVAGRTALAAWGLPGYVLGPVDVVIARLERTADRSIAVVHTSTDLDDGHVTILRGIPIVTPIRAIFDVAGRVHPKRVERVLDTAWARRLVSYELLHRTLEQLGKRGRPGTRLMRELAAARPRSYRPPESNTESRLNELLTTRGHQPLRRQVDAGDGEKWLGRFDLVDHTLPLVVEVHSSLFHGSVLDQQRDKAKRAAMTSAGWTFVEVWDNDIWRSPAQCVARIVAARRSIAPNLSRDRAS